MKVALIFPPFPHKQFSPNLATVDEEFIVPPPIILAYVAAIIEKSGHDVIIIDANSLKLSKEEVLQRVRSYSPDLLGFRMDTFLFQETLQWVKYLKIETNIPTIVGGLNLSYYPKESLSHQEIDFGIIGEAIYALPEFLNNYNSDYTQIDGLAYRKNGKMLINSPKRPAVAFDLYPIPARHLLPNENYYSFLSKRKNFTVMLTSVGCPQKCQFCTIASVPYRARNTELVIAEIKECYEKYNIREIDFFDGDFFINKERAKEICKGIIREQLAITWDARTRVDMVDQDVLQIAKKAGCRQIRYGIESGSDIVLKNLGKDLTVAQIEEVVKLTQKQGIEVMGFFMMGSPGETKQDLQKTIDFAKRLKLDFIQVGRTTPKSGSILSGKQEIDYWREYTLGNVSEKMLEPIDSDISIAEINQYVKKMYVAFYFRPVIMIKTILRVKSFSEISRYVKVAIKLLLDKVSE